MEQDSNEHGGHGTRLERRLPAPSLWPIVAAIAAALLGIALFWAGAEEDDDVTAPVVGATAALAVIVAAGWAFEEGAFGRRMRGEGAARDFVTRHTQVVAFAIAEGELEAARAEGGVLAALEGAERELARNEGFLDLRLTVSPAAAGPSQVLAETGWASRQAFAGYDAGRSTILDIINGSDQVLPGSVQAFDMEVVRDTKELAPRFTMVHGVLALAALVVGGLIVGVIAVATDDGAVAADGGGTGPVVDPYAVEAGDNFFDKATLVSPPNTEVTFVLTNKGKVKHNLAFYTAKGGEELAPGARGEIIDGNGTRSEVTFTTPGVGTYYFQCDLHPTEMFGTFRVEEGAPKPGEVPGPGGGAAEGTVIATDNAFNTKTIEAAAGSDFAVTLKNDGVAVHNLSFYKKKGGELLAPTAQSAIIKGGEQTEVKFKAPGPGTYYFVCDLHPTEMFGDFVVK